MTPLRAPAKATLLRKIAGPAAMLTLATSGLAALASNALYTDAEMLGANAFTTGTVDLDASPATAAITLPNMAPGASKVGYIDVANTGSLAQRYALTSTATNTDGKNLAAELAATIKVGVAECTDAGFDATGTVIYGPDALGAPAGRHLFGDPAQGAQPGDRELAAGASERLCIRAALPLEADNATQGAATVADFAFNAEQVLYNP